MLLDIWYNEEERVLLMAQKEFDDMAKLHPNYCILKVRQEKLLSARNEKTDLWVH